MADNASITILRNTQANINAEPIKDGNILFTTDQSINAIYTDVGTRRIKIGGGNTVDDALSETSVNPVQNKVITNSINDVRGQICTNLLNPTTKSLTLDTLTVTANGDGTYTLNGTSGATTGTDGYIAINLIPLATSSIPIGENLSKMKLVGCPRSGASKDFKLQLADSNSPKVLWVEDYGDGAIFDAVDGKVTLYALRIEVKPNKTFNNLIFKPMLTTDLSATYDDFVQYSGDGELNENVAEIYAESNSAEDALQNEGYKYPIINGVKNYTDSNGVYHKNLGVVDLGTLRWNIEYHSNLGPYFRASVVGLNIKRRGSFDATLHNVSCAKYPTVIRGSSFVDKTLTIDGDLTEVTQVEIKDASYTDTTAFKNAMSGVLLFYELETPQTWNSRSEISRVFDVIRPVGSLYSTTDASFNPNTAKGWHGTWERIKDCVIYAAGDSDTVGSIVGSNTHTLTEAELPSHTHSIPSLSGSTDSTGEHQHDITPFAIPVVTQGATYRHVGGSNDGGFGTIPWNTNKDGEHTHTVTTNASTTGANGSGTAIDMRTRRLNSIVWRRVS